MSWESDFLREVGGSEVGDGHRDCVKRANVWVEVEGPGRQEWSDEDLIRPGEGCVDGRFVGISCRNLCLEASVDVQASSSAHHLEELQSLLCSLTSRGSLSSALQIAKIDRRGSVMNGLFSLRRGTKKNSPSCFGKKTCKNRTPNVQPTVRTEFQLGHSTRSDHSLPRGRQPTPWTQRRQRIANVHIVQDPLQSNKQECITEDTWPA